MSDRSWAGRYELVFGVGLALLFTYGAARSAVPEILAEVERRGYSAIGVSAALCCFAVALWVAGWHFVGPLGISSERLQWMVLRRDPVRWLSGDRRRLLATGAVLAGIVGSLATLALGAVDGSPAALFGLALAAALQSLLLLVLKLQHLDLDAVARAVPATFGLAGVGLSALQAWGVLAAVAVLCCLLGILVASQRHRPTMAIRSWRTSQDSRGGSAGPGELTPRWQLHRGARNRWSMRAGVTMLDTEIVRVVGQRAARTSGRPLPAFVYRLGRPLDLALVVFLRTLGPAGIAAAFSLPFAFAVGEFLGPLAALFVVAPLQFLVTVSMTRSAQAWLAHRALRRTWAADGIRAPVAMVAPGLVCGGGIALVAGAWLALPLPVTALLIALPAAVIVRRRQAGKTSAHLTLLSTPAGAIPLETVNRVVAGPDVVALVLLAASALL